jgi:hypothetical protein
MTLMDRAAAAADRFVERMHGQPRLIDGKRWPTPQQFAAKVAFAAGWLAGYRARRERQ